MSREHRAAPPAFPPRATIIVTPPLLPAPRAEHTPAAASSPLPRAIPGAPQALALRLPDGRRVRVTGNGVMGRLPADDQGYDHVIQLDDPNRELSRNHLAFGLGPDGSLWISDLHSANGTTLDGIPLTPGIRANAPLGALIRVGGITAHVMVA